MQVLCFYVLAFVVTASYELRIFSPLEADVNCTLVGESRSQTFYLAQSMYDGAGILSQILTPDGALGELHEMILTSGTSQK